MTDNNVLERLAGIEEHLRSIDKTIGRWVQCRHVTKDGECGFFTTVVDHDRRISQWAGAWAKIEEHETKLNQWSGDIEKIEAHETKINQWEPDIKKIPAHDKQINQWTGAMTAIGVLSAFIGGLIGALAVKLGLK